MHLELVELLRCPNNHAPGVLVAAADEIQNRYVVNGVLGCPDCLAEYSVRAGVTHFVKRSSASDHATGQPDVAVDHGVAVDRDVAMRLAAQLGLSAGRTVFALIGFSVEMALAMRDIVAARVLVLNPAQLLLTGESLSSASQIAPFGVMCFGETLPLAARKFDGIAFAASHRSENLLNQAVPILRPGARLVAPADALVPSGMRELVRDASVWVAEKEQVATAPIALRRR